MAGDMTGSSASRYFSDSYGTARKRFLDAAKAAEAVIESVQNPYANGPRDEPLYMDVALAGPGADEGGRSLIVITSAVHGVEGFCGSGIQTGLLREDRHLGLPTGTAVLMVHAVNPFGFAHVRRVNEDNVDLNRNFLDHDLPYPDDAAYRAIHGFVAAPDLGTGKTARDEDLRAYIEKNGMPAFQAAVSCGQWTRPDGLFFGGTAPAWSNRVLTDILRRYAQGFERIAHIDLHTGLGPYGHGELIGASNVHGSFDRAKDWYGDEVTSLHDGSSVSAPVRGVISHLWEPYTPAAQVTSVTLEYGTRDLMTVLDALRLDNWLYLHGDVESGQGKNIKAQIRDALYPDKDDWKDMVFARADEIFAKTVAGLAKD